LIAQFCALAAVYGMSLASVTLVEEQTHSSAQTGLVLLSAILPAFLGSLVSGVIVDRQSRAQVLAFSHLVRTLATLTFFAGTRFLSPGPALIAVYAANIAAALFSQFALTSELALLPDLVGQRYLMSANALLQVSMLAAEGLGIVALSPLLIKLAGEPAVGLSGGALCLLALALVSGLPKDRISTHPDEAGEPIWANLGKDLQAGWQTIGRDRLLRLVAIQATLAATLLLVLLSLVPGLASRHLGLNVEDAPLLMLPGGLGFLLGSILIGRREGRTNRLRILALGLGGVGLTTLLLAILSSEPGRLWLVLPLILGLGLMLALVVIPARTILQEYPPPELRGRVIAAQLALANATAVLPLLLGGTLADQIGIRPVMGLLGLLALGAGAVGLYQGKEPAG
jgi:MFS family permease